MSFVTEGKEEIIHCYSFADAVTEINNQKVKRDYVITLKEVSEDNSKITVYIPNEEQPGKYNVELYKVDEKGNVINSSAKFNINGSDAETKMVK